jgi:putative FmdB family regulatory protein
MPMYDLRCPECGHEFEDLVSSHDAVGETSCEACGYVGMELKPSLFAAGSLAGAGGSSSAANCAPGPFR